MKWTICVLLFLGAVSSSQAKEPNKGEKPRESSVAYTTSKGEVFSCKAVGGKIIDYNTCRSAREPSNKLSYRRWCEDGKPMEGLFYDTDFGFFKCIIDKQWCTPTESGLSHKFCVDYSVCRLSDLPTTEDKCFDKKR